MALSKEARNYLAKVKPSETKLGEIKALAKEIGQNHTIAMELWSTKDVHARLLAVLVMEKKVLSQQDIERLAKDIESHPYEEANRLADWLMANQLSKDKKTTALLETWQKHSSSILRRLFWYHQARLRWTGKTPPNNTADLLASLEKDMGTEEPRVQWAMNFAAGQIGIHDRAFRARCIELGKKLALYKDEPVPRGCTPNYLPEFIRIEAAKLSKK